MSVFRKMAQFGSQLKLLQESLLNCVEEGPKMVTSLLDSSLFEGQSRSFYNPSTRSKLKSFEDMTHKTKLKCRSGNTVTVHINPELVFRRELVLANCRRTLLLKRFCLFQLVRFQHNCFTTMAAQCAKPVRQILYINWNRTFSIIQTLPIFFIFPEQL